jgi:hypothetical protein
MFAVEDVEAVAIDAVAVQAAVDAQAAIAADIHASRMRSAPPPSEEELSPPAALLPPDQNANTPPHDVELEDPSELPSKKKRRTSLQLGQTRTRRVGKIPTRTEEPPRLEDPPTLKVHSKHDEKWNDMFSKLVEFKQQFKTTLVPQCYDQEPRLGRWVHYQRVEYWLYQSKGKAKISPDRIARLDTIGFEWDPQRAQWEYLFRKLQQFTKEHSHCKVPKGYTRDPELANWVRNQRLVCAWVGGVCWSWIVSLWGRSLLCFAFLCSSRNMPTCRGVKRYVERK